MGYLICFMNKDMRWVRVLLIRILYKLPVYYVITYSISAGSYVWQLVPRMLKDICTYSTVEAVSTSITVILYYKM
jgi:hypothetical protein